MAARIGKAGVTAASRTQSQPAGRRRGALLAGASLASLLFCGPALADKWSPSLDALGRAGSDQGGGALDLMVPLWQDDDTLLYGNALGGLDSDTSTGTALGLGLRLQLDESVIVGGYVFGDWLRTSHDNAFFQVTGGLEVMTEDWDLRATGYLPLTGERLVAGRSAVDGTAGSGGIGVGTGTLVLQGNELGIQWEGIDGAAGVDGFKDQEALLAGGEGEVGWKLPLDRALGKNWEVRTYLGGYYFSAEDYDTFAGPRMRVELRGYDLAFMGDGARVTLGAEASWDDPRGVTGAGLLRVRIPLGWFTGERKELSALDRRMVDPIPRRITPFTDQRHEVITAAVGSPGGGAFEAVESPRTGNDDMTAHEITSVYFVSGSGTGGDAGTAADPTSLANAVASAGVGGLVVVLGGDGNVTGSAELLGNQILIGGATSIAVRGVTSGQGFTFNPGDFVTAGLATRPTIVSDVAAGEVTLGTATVGRNGTWIAGLDIQLGDLADQRSGVFYIDTSNHLVQDVDITGGLIGVGAQTSATGMLVENLRFDDITTEGTNAGFTLANQVVGATLRDVTLENSTLNNGTNGVLGRSIFISADNSSTISGLTISNVDVTNGGNLGVLFGNVSDLVINDLSVTARAGVVFGSGGVTFQTSIDDNNHDITVDGLTIAGYTNALRLTNLQTASFNDVTLTDNLLLGIDLVSSDDVSFTNSSIVGTGTAMGMADIAFRITDSTGITVQNLVVDGRTTGGTLVTDTGFQLQAVTVNLSFNAGSTGNTVEDVTFNCNVSGPMMISGSISYDDLDDGVGPILSCP